ncbi:MMPL family transporter [Streptomyces rimosus]|uniref:MMPL family transporter n=1 Tax=Streptomyces rimosus TaxID=1927 RepID=UPI0004C4BC3F|nr:MMPL family transporter [Streptomyces rimosus]
MGVTGLKVAVGRLAGWSAGHPWPALALWLAVVAASVTGGALALRTPVGDLFDHDSTGRRVLGYALAGTAVVLVLLVALLAAVLPAVVSLLVSVSAVAVATGWWSVVARLFPGRDPSASVFALVAVLGTALGLTYCVLYLWFERRARRHGARRPHVSRTAADASRAVLLSSLVTAAVVCGLFVSGDAMLSAVAIGVILTVAAVMLAALTVLPAVTARFGRRLGWPRLPVLWRLTYRLGPPRLWPLLLRPSTRRPGWTFAASVVLLATLALPLAWWRPELPGHPPALLHTAEAAQAHGITATTIVAVIAATVLLGFAALTAVFRSAPAAVAVTVPATLAAAAACGTATVALRTWKPEQPPSSWGHSTPAAWAPLLSFALALAVSVLLLRMVVLRITELRAAGLPPREATARALTSTSDGTTVTAVIMGAVFLLAERTASAEVGRLSAVLAMSVVLTATVVRALALPALSVLLSGTGWWARSAARQAGQSLPQK